MFRVLAGILCAAVAALVGLLVSLAAADRRYVERGGRIEPAAVRAAMAREGAEALRLGMRLEAQGDAAPTERGSVGVWSMPVAIGAGECVAVVVGVDGAHRVARVAIQGSNRAPDEVAPDAMAVAHNGGGLVAHAQWCEREAVPRRAVVTSERVATMSQRVAPSTLRWALYRGRWEAIGGPVRLTRGALRSESLSGLGDDLAAREAAALFPPGATALGAPLPLTSGHVRLVPADARAYAALIRASQSNENPRVNPRVDPTPVAGVPWSTGFPLDFGVVRAASGADLSLPLHDPVVDLGRNDFRRVLAVVDRARLGVPCARIVLVRQRYAHAARAWALDDRGARRELPARENLVLDEGCPVQGPTVYLVPANDHDVWTLHALR